jgi:putative endonuclease
VRAKDRLGRLGEDLAAVHLEQQGLTLIERNWRCREGEIDIIASEGDVLVVCEVKTRTSHRFGTPLEAVDHAKVRRLQRLGFAWCVAHDLRATAVRIDVVEVLAPRGSEPVLTHHRGVL